MSFLKRNFTIGGFDNNLCANKLRNMICLDNNNYDTTKKPTVFTSQKKLTVNIVNWAAIHVKNADWLQIVVKVAGLSWLTLPSLED